MRARQKSTEEVSNFVVVPPKEVAINSRDRHYLHDTIDRLRGLLEEALAQLSKTDDEYHTELGDKIRVELGMVKENSLQSA